MLQWLHQLRQDVRFGARTFVRTPGFTTLAVLSLALGIMATTAMYSVIHAVVLDPFPYKDVDALMSVKSGVRSNGGSARTIPRTSFWRSRIATRSSKAPSRRPSPTCSGRRTAIHSAFAGTTERQTPSW